MKLLPLAIDKLDEIVQLWNQELQKDFPMRKELMEQNSFLDENVCYEASCIVVNDNKRVVGFVIAKRWQETLNVGMDPSIGWIQALLVDQNYRHQGIGTMLLNHAEQTLKEKSIQKIILGRDPWHYFPGIPKDFPDAANWFKKKGYKKQGEDFDLKASYFEDDIKLPSIDGVTFSILAKKEKDELLDFLHRCFPGRWEYEAIHYFQKGGNGREFVVLKKADNIIGFCRINDSHSTMIAQNVYWAPLFQDELGGIGPLGVDAKERKQGYGLAIVEAAVAFLRQRGIKQIIIDWTGLVDFYKRLGFDVWKQYESYKKMI